MLQIIRMGKKLSFMQNRSIFLMMLIKMKINLASMNDIKLLIKKNISEGRKFRLMQEKKAVTRGGKNPKQNKKQQQPKSE